jgi:hypothetical protein
MGALVSESSRVDRWWNLLTDVDRQRVQEFHAHAHLPADLVQSYVEVVGGPVVAEFGAEVFKMPEALIRFLDELRRELDADGAHGAE